MAKILEGIRVLDLTQFLSGPFCTQLLAGMGAEVIRIETPGRGAPERSSPPFAGPKGVSVKRQTPDDMSLSVLKRSRNKKSVTLNLKAEEGKKLFLEMVKSVDVVMENFRPGTLEKLGVPYEKMKKVNPAIIFCSLNGFGDIEEYSKMPAFDIVVQAMSGSMSVNGDKDGPPTKTGIAITDLAAGLYSCVGILAAIIYRDKTGKGQKVGVSMMESALSFIFDEAPDFWQSQGFATRNGSRLARLTPFNIFSAKDGYYVISSGSNKHWQDLLQAMGREDLATDERYLEIGERAKRTYEIDNIINSWSSSLTVGKVLELLQAFGIPCAKVREINEVISDQVLLKAGSILPVHHPVVGKVEDAISWDNPISFSRDNVRFSRPAPAVGEHNDEIYSSILGLSTNELEALKEKGVI